MVRTIGLLSILVLAGVGALEPGELGVAWKRTRTLAAPEAFQAAAADRDHVYAISSTQIARYDRNTGKRSGLSKGPAQHLNSGYLWEGKLYCAHSNYPRTPEISAIKVLDLKSLELSTFRDFGDFGGSLTWAVRKDGAWWCNFARYGKDNGRTFLVRFDEVWKERGRWTYPPEVVQALGSYSLSGGLWRGEDLLVTGHDDPVVFRLRLPAQGSVLEYRGKEKVPFTGQGIAADPATGGLVGIDRGKRQVVFAESPEPAPVRLRVLTYNIHHGEGVDGKLDLERIARVIRGARPDLVALQEVDKGVKRTKGVDQPAELARRTEMRVVFGANLKLQGGEYGNAVLSRFPLRGIRNHALPSFDAGEPRGVLDVEVAVPGMSRPVRFLATHLDHRRPNRERLASARAIREWVAKEPAGPALLAGDLNDVPGSPTLKEFEAFWKRVGKDLLTVPVDKPGRQIDFILVRPPGSWHVVEAMVLEEAVASDHRPVLAVLEWRP